MTLSPVQPKVPISWYECAMFAHTVCHLSAIAEDDLAMGLARGFLAVVEAW